MDKRQILGYSGAVALLVGIFLPLYTASAGMLSISISIAQAGQLAESFGELAVLEVLLIVAALAAGVLAFLKRFKFLVYPGALALVLSLYVFIKVQSNPAASILTPGLAWLFLLGGAGALIAGTFLKPKA